MIDEIIELYENSDTGRADMKDVLRVIQGHAPIAEFEYICCPKCNSPRCDHNISDINFSECRECGETFTLHNIKEKRVVVYEKLKREK